MKRDVTPETCPIGAQLYWRSGSYVGHLVHFVYPDPESHCQRLRLKICSFATNLEHVFYADSFEVHS